MRIKMTRMVTIPFIFSGVPLLDSFRSMLWMLSNWNCSRRIKTNISLIVSKHKIKHCSFCSFKKFKCFRDWIHLRKWYLLFYYRSNFRIKERPCKTVIPYHFNFCIEEPICFIKNWPMMSISHNMINCFTILYLNHFFSKL